jgi:acyl-CoA synthetase (AMP-forming)/AMP-acid ligase II
MSVSAEITNLADMVRAQAEALGGAAAYEFEGRQTSLTEFDRKTNRVANALRALGIKREHAALKTMADISDLRRSP